MAWAKGIRLGWPQPLTPNTQLPHTLPAIPDAGLKAFASSPLTFTTFLRWKMTASLARVSKFLAASANARVATVSHLRQRGFVGVGLKMSWQDLKREDRFRAKNAKTRKGAKRLEEG